jgi:hypothetical protein
MSKTIRKASGKRTPASPKRNAKKGEAKSAASPKRKGVKKEAVSPKAPRLIVNALKGAKAKSKAEDSQGKGPGSEFHGLQMRLVNQLRYRATCPTSTEEERTKHAKTLEDYFAMRRETKDSFVKEFALNNRKVKDLKWTHKFHAVREAGRSSSSNTMEDFYTRLWFIFHVHVY